MAQVTIYLEGGASFTASTDKSADEIESLLQRELAQSDAVKLSLKGGRIIVPNPKNIIAFSVTP